MLGVGNWKNYVESVFNMRNRAEWGFKGYKDDFVIKKLQNYRKLMKMKR